MQKFFFHKYFFCFLFFYSIQRQVFYEHKQAKCYIMQNVSGSDTNAVEMTLTIVKKTIMLTNGENWEVKSIF